MRQETRHHDSSFRWCASGCRWGAISCPENSFSAVLVFLYQLQEWLLRDCCCESVSGVMLGCYGAEFWIGIRKTQMIAEKKDKVPQPFGKRIGKPGKVVTSKREVEEWEQGLDCWELYRSTKDRGTLETDKQQEQHSILSKKVNQSYHWWLKNASSFTWNSS